MSGGVTIASMLGIAASVLIGLLIWRAPPNRRPAEPAELVRITVVHQGSPRDNEQAIAIPLQAALAKVKDLEQLRSESRAGTVLVTFSFRPGTDGLDAAQSARESLVADLRQRIARDLPGVRWRGVRTSPFAPPPRLAVTRCNDTGEAPEAFAARAKDVEARLVRSPGSEPRRGTTRRSPRCSSSCATPAASTSTAC